MEEMNELTAEERARILQHELEAVYGSSSYKIGRAVTWLPRHAKKALAYLAHNGPAISAKYLYTYAKYHKVANKEYAYWACLQKKDYPEALKKWFLEMNYTHQPLDLEHPKTFSEKTQWLKLYGHLDEQRDLVDKYKVATGSGRKSARNILSRCWACGIALMKSTLTSCQTDSY